MKALLIFPALALNGLVLALPARAQWEKVKGDGTVKSEDRQVSGSFTNISNSAIFHVFVTQGSPATIKVEADENLLPYILTDISGDELDLRTKKGYNIESKDSANIYVTLPEVTGLHTSGQGSFQSENQLKVKDLDISVSGQGDVNLDIAGGDIKTDISGSAQVNLKGNSDATSYSISGQGDVKAFDLQSSSCDIHISGMGDAEISTKDHLDVAISGMGNVKYKGNPSVHQKVSGMGKISSE